MIPSISLLVLSLPGLAVAQSGDPLNLDAFPRVATVQLEGCGDCTTGAAMIRVPPGLRSIDDPDDGSDLILLDAEGQSVPFAVARGLAPPHRRSLDVWSTDSPSVVRVNAPPLAIDGIEVSLRETTSIARMKVVDENTGRTLVAPTLIWTHEVGDHRTVYFEPTNAPLRVVFEWLGRPPRRIPGMTGLRSSPPSLAPDQLLAPVVDRRITEDGFVDYTVQLDGPIPVDAIDLGDADAAVISRDVTVDTPDGPGRMSNRLGTGSVRRVRVGDATLDATRVPLSRPPPADRFIVRLASSGQPVLDIEEVGIELEGEAIWFQPTGAGPYTLLGGAPPQTRPPSELQVALSELVRLPTPVVLVSKVEPHGAYVHPVLRSGLASPGRPLPEPEAFAWTATITGESGMVRIPLGAEVQAASQVHLEDLRLTEIDEQQRQIPHLLRRSPVDPTVSIDMATVERIEDGGISRLLVPISDPDLAVSTVTVATKASAFKRRVTLLRPAGDHLKPLRSVSWTGADRPYAIGIGVEEVVGDQLIIEVDNGDDPPLPIHAITLARIGWELVAVVPEDGAVLHGGALNRATADFDLQLYADDLTEAASKEATVGPLQMTAPAPIAFIDRASLLAGLVVLVLGLAALTVRLLRAVPPLAEPPSKDDPSKDVPSKDDPNKDDPSKDVPSKDAPSKDAPSKDAPNKDVPNKDDSEEAPPSA